MKILKLITVTFLISFNVALLATVVHAAAFHFLWKSLIVLVWGGLLFWCALWLAHEN